LWIVHSPHVNESQKDGTSSLALGLKYGNPCIFYVSKKLNMPKVPFFPTNHSVFFKKFKKDESSSTVANINFSKRKTTKCEIRG
jgi:hypothetical protein